MSTLGKIYGNHNLIILKLDKNEYIQHTRFCIF